MTWGTGDEVKSADLRVRRVREGDVADFRDLVGAGVTDANQPYYVDASVEADDTATFTGHDIPLFLRDTAGVLSPAWGFAEPFGPCPSDALRDPVPPGEPTDLCLVFVATDAARFDSVVLVAGADVGAVEWSGEVAARGEQRRRRPGAEDR